MSVMDNILRRATHPASDARHDVASQFDRSEHETSELLNPVAGWSIVLLISLGLWWGLWVGVSSLVSAVL